MVLVPVKLTGLGNVRALAPVTVIFAPTWIVFALVNDKLVNGALLPTAPLNDTTPAVPARKVKDVAPLTVVEKLILAPPADPPAFVLSKVGVFVKLTGPVMPIVPAEVVMFPFRLMAVEPV